MCDLAETYRIYDYKSLPLTTVAAFSVGLRDDSRIKLKLSGMEHSMDRLLLAGAVDRLSNMVWMNSEDGMKGRNRPQSIMSILMQTEEVSADVTGFWTSEDFEKERRRILGGEV